MIPNLQTKQLLAGLLVAAGAFSCSSDSTGTGPVAPFSLTAHITHAGGAPVAGIQVAFWNDLTITPVTAAKDAPVVRNPAAVSVINFGVPARSRVLLKVVDFYGDPFGAALVDTILEAGYYMSLFHADTTLPIAVLKCIMEGRDSASNALLERLNILMLLYQPDQLRSRNGYSDPGGMFKTSNALAFPNVLGIRHLTATYDDPTPLGSISVLDSVTVVLYDTATGAYERYRRKISAGANDLSFVFSPPAAPPSAPTPASVHWTTDGPVRLPGSAIPSRFQLEQNYPNPFN